MAILRSSGTLKIQKVSGGGLQPSFQLRIMYHVCDLFFLRENMGLFNGLDGLT